ncbi:hypothetical protein [uncultured Tateyamaria sp.]|uniref:hypothetical protein n=1 Tax=uncultured Tateyamaria sp. TaxID=455651 RepID=UPI00263786C9|nr:hypothetical protein [uncultured Tateyamaria sp.]
MKRLKKHWKVVAYLLGFIVLSLNASDAVIVAYGLPGLAWLVVWIFRHHEPRRPGDKKRDDNWPLDGYSRHYSVDSNHPRHPYSQS